MDYMKLLGRKKNAEASVWKRLLAFIIDFFLINFLMGSVILWGQFPEFETIKEMIEFSQHPSTEIMASFFILYTLLFLYFVILEYKVGQTVGKMLLKIRVVSETGKLTVWQCILRSLFIIPLFPFELLWIADPLYLLLIGKTKRLSEVISKTNVVEFRG